MKKSPCCCSDTCSARTPTWSAATGRSGWGTGSPCRTPARCRPGSSSSPSSPPFFFYSRARARPLPSFPPSFLFLPPSLSPSLLARHRDARGAQVTVPRLRSPHDWLGLCVKKKWLQVSPARPLMWRDRRGRWREGGREMGEEGETVALI